VVMQIEGGVDVSREPHPRSLYQATCLLGEGAVNLFVQHRLQHRQFGWIFYPECFRGRTDEIAKSRFFLKFFIFYFLRLGLLPIF